MPKRLFPGSKQQWATIIRRTSMCLLFLVVPYAARLPKGGNEQNLPLWVALAMVLLEGGAIIALVIAGGAWLLTAHR